MSKRPVQVLLEDMREAAARIQEYTKGMVVNLDRQLHR